MQARIERCGGREGLGPRPAELIKRLLGQEVGKLLLPEGSQRTRGPGAHSRILRHQHLPLMGCGGEKAGARWTGACDEVPEAHQRSGVNRYRRL